VVIVSAIGAEDRGFESRGGVEGFLGFYLQIAIMFFVTQLESLLYFLNRNKLK
jgi:hypothetical protein